MKLWIVLAIFCQFHSVANLNDFFCIIKNSIQSILDIDKVIVVTWHLYTRNNGQIQAVASTSPILNTSKPLKMFLHGFLQNSNNPEYLLLKDSYLQMEDCNVVILDWSNYNNEYLTAVGFTRTIGDMLGAQLYKMYKNSSFDNIHLLGHSLGAHMAGFMGKQVISLSGGTKQIGRITGWDPAMPLYEPYFACNALSKYDAKMVDVHHSDSFKLGIGEAIGTVDFYPNGGMAPQPGCSDGLANVMQILSGKLISLSCSHGKCREYYRYSITNASIYATECSSWFNFQAGLCNGNKKIVFGEYIPADAKGTYFLVT